MSSLNNIKLPDNIDLLTENAIRRGEKYKNNKKKHRRMFATAASICLVATIGIISIGVGAESLGFARNVFKELKQIVGVRGSSEVNKTINKTVTDNEVSLTLQEVVCDEYGVYTSFIVKSKEPFMNTNDTQLLLYDDYAETNFHKGNLDNGGKAGLEGKFIDKYTFIGVESYLFKDLKAEIPKNFTLDINIGAISLNSIQDNNIVRGNWRFSVPVSLNGEGVKVITPSIKHNDILIKKIILSKLNTFIEMEMPSNLEKQKVNLLTGNGSGIDSISTEFIECNGKMIIKQRFKGIPDDINNLIINFEDGKNIIVNLKQ